MYRCRQDYITISSLIESIGGFVTWANLCLKNWNKLNSLFINTAKGISLPIDTTFSAPFVANGMILSINSSYVYPTFFSNKSISYSALISFSFSNFSSLIIFSFHFLYGCFVDYSFFIISFDIISPFSVSTNKILPGSSLFFSTMLASSIGRDPVSENKTK